MASRNRGVLRISIIDQPAAAEQGPCMRIAKAPVALSQ
jgi:hypothetical protein